MKDLSVGMKNENGKLRSLEANILLMYAIEAALNRMIEALKDKTICPTEVSWRNIKEEIARDFHARPDLRKEFFRNGDVMMFGEYTSDDDGIANM